MKKNQEAGVRILRVDMQIIPDAPYLPCIQHNSWHTVDSQYRRSLQMNVKQPVSVTSFSV